MLLVDRTSSIVDRCVKQRIAIVEWRESSLIGQRYTRVHPTRYRIRRSLSMFVYTYLMIK